MSRNISYNSDLGTGKPTKAQLDLVERWRERHPDIVEQALKEMGVDSISKLNKTEIHQLISTLRMKEA